MNFPHLGKFTNLKKDLKYENQSIFPCGGGSNLILRRGTENQIFFQRTPAAIKFLSPNSQKMILWCKKKFITHPNGFV